MSTKPIYLFIDTSAYLKSKLDFSDSIYSKLKLLIDENKVYALTSSIINRELMSHVSSVIKKDYIKLKSIKNDSISAYNSKFLNTLSSMDIDQAVLIDMANFEENFFKFSSEELKIDSVNMDKIFNDYFNNTAPFKETGNKKSEFPDAVTLHSILLKVKNKQCHIISTDPDWKDFCELHDNLIYYDSIGAFINYCNEQGIAVTKEIQDAIKQEENYITDCIQNQVNNFELYISPDFNIANESAEITSDVECIYESDFNVIDIDEDERSCVIDVNCLVSFIAKVTGDDYNTAMYDKEDNSWYFVDDVNLDVSVERKFNIQITASYDYDENHKLYLEINEVDGVDPITIEYNDYDPDYPLYK